MKEVYRIKKGKLTILSQIISFEFGLIFEEDGVFYFDFYIVESFDLLDFMENKEKVFLRNIFSMTALTDENNEIEATELSILNITPHKSFMKMKSYGFLKHTEVRKDYVDEKEIKEDQRQTLFYLELEGLKMQFSELTETIRARGGVKIKDYNDHVWDHTSALLIYDSPTNVGCNNFQFTFLKNEESENIYVELPNYRDYGPNVLHYDTFQDFKRDLTFLISLLNGAEVRIRKEFIGGFYNIGKVNSQTVISYSFKTIKNSSYNKYVPLNDYFIRSNNVLEHTFLNCFNKYIEENKTLDLNSIIFYLNGAEQSRSIEEKFFVLIIAFERLAQKFVETLNNVDTFVLPDEDYHPIKKELFEVLEKHRSKNKNIIDKFKSKIGELHKIKKTGIEYKFNKLLEYANIPPTPDIDKIIDEVRHKTVHHGEIGSGDDGYKNFIVLDELLRDIILNIIGYEAGRVSLYRNESEIPKPALKINTL